MKKTARAAFFVFILFITIAGAFSVKKHRLGGFSLSKIIKAPNKGEFPEFLKDEKLAEILSNSYSYLGKGTQFYAFISEDQKYVIKMLRSDRLTIPLYKRLFSSYILKMDAKNKRRKERFFKACEIAYNKLKDQTGVIYLHLKSTVNLPKVTIIDNYGLHIKIDLNDFCFLVQKKAVLIKDAFLESKKQKDFVLAKQKICSFFHLLKYRAKNEISNTDPNVFQNFGFIENQAIEIDFGDFYGNPYLLKNDSTYTSEIDKYAQVLRCWLVDFWPELIPYFDEQHNYTLQK